MTLNRDLFLLDPTSTKIPNDGVAKVVEPKSDQEWQVLEWELRSFVCEGEYARGLDRILGSFLTSLAEAQQPAAWVSGFYGSGKSHLVRVLEFLWRNPTLPSGETARSLVNLASDVSDHIAELATAGKREGGLWSAAGTLAAGKSSEVRLAFLSVVLGSAGLPEQYHLGRFAIWARNQGYWEPIEQACNAAGKSVDKEILNLYVSPVIAQALLDKDATLGDDVAGVRALLREQYPPDKDISDDEMFSVVDDVLRLKSDGGDKYPLTLIVLDEMQQYIGEDNDKALAVQNIVEGCGSQFGSRVLIVATGQSALGATPTLQKVKDRFPIEVPLSANDVESVVRKVVLRKDPTHVPELEQQLDEVSGEINRELGGTLFGPRAADKNDLVPDYPLLPTRRRFWDAALRAIDRAGKAGVLRTQLRVVHEATRAVAEKPIGNVVGGDFVYEQQSAGMLQTGLLLKEIDELIRGLRTEGPDGVLKSRICALVFLIGQLPSRTLGGETGLTASAGFIADLLVEDLENDGATHRRRVPELLDELVIDGRLMKVSEEYHLQTEEGAEWEQDYQVRLTAIRADAARMARLREEGLQRAVDESLRGLKLLQGASKTQRDLVQHWGADEPGAGSAAIALWIRDEWSFSESAVRRSIAEAGDQSPVVFVFLPKRDAKKIADALARAAAAAETDATKPSPQTEEGRVAQQAMRTRLATEQQRLKELVDGVVAHARVFQGGGNELTTQQNLRAAVETASKNAMVRLFPKFSVADNPNWGKVVTKARDGDPAALAQVGHTGDPLSHQVVKEVLDVVTTSGTKGADVQKALMAPLYGWPKDAVNGALLTLFASGHVRATLDGANVSTPKELQQQQVGKATFLKEDDPPTTQQRLAVRSLLQAAGIPPQPTKEGPQIPALLQRLKDLAARAGGAPPLPESPDTSQIDALLGLAGNQQFRAVAETHELLSHSLTEWRAAEQAREQREAEWRELERLVDHARGLPIRDSVMPAVDAIRSGRQLLNEPDPVHPLLETLTDALRTELNVLAAELTAKRAAALEEIRNSPEWSQVEAARQDQILMSAQMASEGPLEISTDEKLLGVLDARSLSGWRDQISLVATRVDGARRQIAEALGPETVIVPLPKATLKSSDDLEQYLSEVRELLEPLVEKKIVVI